MSKLEPILDNIWRKMEDPIIPIFAGRRVVFFLKVSDEYCKFKLFGAQKAFADQHMGELVNRSAAELTFTFTWDEQFTIPMTIGFCLLDGGLDQDEHGRAILESYLLGVKQAICLGLQMERENQRKRRISDIINRLHSSIDLQHILNVLYSSIPQLFPNGKLNIYLSHDYETTLPVQKLSFVDNECDNQMKAFLRGKPYIYKEDHSKGLNISVPLKGNQGTYGVIQFTYPQQKVNQKIVQSITLIAEAAGIAIETAILYQQSQHLISQLRLINDTTQLLNKTLNFEENIDHLIREIGQIFKPEGIQFLNYLAGEQVYELLKGTGNKLPHEPIDLKTCQIIKKVHDTKEAILIPDISKMDDVHLDEEIAQSFRSFIAVPLIHNMQIQGLLIITHSKPYYFSFEDYRLIQNLVNHASLAIANSKLHQELNKMVITDHLTRLYARSYLDQGITLSQNRDKQGAFILIDIDNFKLINDTYGHQTGDDVLIQVANIIKSSIRADDIAARWGGEELAIYLPNANRQIATQVAERIRSRVSRETSPQVTISVGISFWEEEDQQKSLDKLFQQADQLLYRAKTTGKNQVVASV